MAIGEARPARPSWRDFWARAAGDNIVIRRGDVLFAGCLIKSMEARAIGFTGDADLGAWPAAVRRIPARSGKLTLIPGHGAIDSPGGAYQHTLDLLSSALPAKR
jgi:metallo-beta-lactamase class B